MVSYLFFSFLKIGFFCFGGGNAMISVFEQMFVYDAKILSSVQFADIVAISQITPGPVAVNIATYVGAVLGKTPGQSIFYAFVATFGVSLPAFIIVIFIAKFFRHFSESVHVKRVMGGIKPGVIGLIVGSVFLMMKFSIYDENVLKTSGLLAAVNFSAVVLCVAAFILSMKTKISPILILIGSGLIGILIF